MATGKKYSRSTGSTFPLFIVMIPNIYIYLYDYPFHTPQVRIYTCQNKIIVQLMFIIFISFDKFPMSFLPRVRVSEHCEYFYSWIGCEVKCSDKQDNDQDRCSGRHPSTERNVDIQ